MKLGHIAISISNLAKSTAFYKKNFGLKCAEKYRIKTAGLKICILKKGDVALELFEFKNYKALPKYRRDINTDLKTLGAKHFAFEVSNIEEAYKKLKKSKVKVVTDIRVFENGLKYFFIKDPDGILVEIMEAKSHKKVGSYG